MKTAHIFTPVVTVFDEHGNLDIQGNKNIFDHLIKGGVAVLSLWAAPGSFSP